MKNQLLEDIDDSNSEPSSPTLRRARSAKPAARPEPPSPPEAAPRPAAAPRPEVWSRRRAQPQADTLVDAAPPFAGPPVRPAPAPQPRQRAGVWRSRAASAPLGAEAVGAAPPPPPPPAQPPQPRPDPGPGPQAASFASRAPDWAAPLPDEPLPWTERWGRKALGWSLGIAAAVALAGAGSWMVRETQVESTLAVVAGNAPAKLAVAPVPAAPKPIAPAEPEYLPPPLKLLPREPVAAVPAAAPAPGALPPDTPAATPDKIAAAVQEPAPARPAARPRATPRPVAPKLKQVPERRIAKAAAAKPSRAAQEKPKAGRARERVVASVPKWPVPRMEAEIEPPARAAAPPRATPQPDAPAPQTGAESPLAETLRMCRAAGYHATACIKRGCEATRFGLACRG